jgi:hypothetical protein
LYRNRSYAKNAKERRTKFWIGLITLIIEKVAYTNSWRAHSSWAFEVLGIPRNSIAPAVQLHLHILYACVSEGSNCRGGKDAVKSALRSRADEFGKASIAKSCQSYASRLKAWILFACLGLFEGGVLSASPSDMLLFVGLFRNAWSAEKYVQAVRWMYVFLNRPVTWESKKLRQTLTGGKKLNLARGVKPRFAIRWPVLRSLVRHAWSRRDFLYALAYILAANFLLRCKAELLTARYQQFSFDLSVDPPVVCLELESRKNMPQGTTMKRRCICDSHPDLCPVHIFGLVVKALGCTMLGPIFNFSYQSFHNVLRAHLTALGVENAQKYTSKAFRRGTAQEMVASGSSLAEVLAAGQWRSSAFMLYLDKAEIEEEAIFAALDALSDDDDEDQPEKQPAKRRRKAA